MRGSRGPPRADNAGGKFEPACWVVDCRLRCWRDQNPCGFRTAVCTPQIDLFFFRNYSQKRKNAVWVEPLTDTWNSFVQHSQAAKHSFSGVCLFLQFWSYYTDSKLCGESSLLCHSLTLAPRCPVRRFRVSARVNSPPWERAGTNRATAAGLSFPCRA